MGLVAQNEGLEILMKVTREFLYAVAPGASASIVDQIVANADRIKITDATELAYFLGQSACETGGFTTIDENLYYTSVARIRAVWPSRFKSDSAAAPYVRNPQRLANKVYGGRFGNRPDTNDGWDYRGSGIKQTTFRANFAEVEATTGVKCVAHPELLREFPDAVDAAVVYWNKRNLGRFAKAGDLLGLTKAVNGGTNGLADRKTFTDRALRFIKSGKVTTLPSQKTERTDWLRRGSKDPARVKELQTKLRLAGFYVDGLVDGVFGAGTDRAVRDFQTAKGLISDGVAGPATLAALDSALNPPAPDGEQPAGLAGLFAALIQAILKLFARKGSEDGEK